MVIRQLKQKHWECVYRQIITQGRALPLSLQFDIDLNYNRINYIIKVQPGKKRKLFALQALEIYSDDKNDQYTDIGNTRNKNYHLIEDNVMLSALFEIFIYQCIKTQITTK